jgi:hypothetical protein
MSKMSVDFYWRTNKEDFLAWPLFNEFSVLTLEMIITLLCNYYQKTQLSGAISMIFREICDVGDMTWRSRQPLFLKSILG